MDWAGTPGHRILTLKKTLRVDVNVEPDLALAPGRGGGAAGIPRRWEERAKRRGDFPSSGKRWRPRTTASGASAGPSTRTSFAGGATAASRRAKNSAAVRSPAETRRLASRPNGG